MMFMLKRILPIPVRWLPAILIMGAIFFFSSRSSAELPNFDVFDYFIKKTGHVIGYGLLAFSYHYAFDRRDRKSFYVAWLMAILYAFTDEYHQSFVGGRHPSFWDVMIFDNLGASLMLYFISRRHKNESIKT